MPVYLPTSRPIPLVGCAARWMMAFAAAAILTGCASSKESGRIYKVLPTLVDRKQRQSLSPSLFERDAYQAYLRKHPAEIGGRQFDIHWRASAATGLLRVTIEVRTTERSASQPLMFEKILGVGRHGGWTRFIVGEKAFLGAGEVVAWRARLLDGDAVISEQRSFLW